MLNLFLNNNVLLSNSASLSSVTMYSPLEQFEVFPFIGLNVGSSWGIAFTNLNFYDIVATLAVLAMFYMFDNETRLKPNSYSLVFESIYDSAFGIISEQLGDTDYSPYFPWIFTLFTFIILVNLNGNIPYSYAVTASAIFSIGLSFSIWLGVTLVSVSIYKLRFFGTFLPQGTPLALVPLLVVVELISYFARSISLGIRLMANITAGHTLLKILASFIYPLMLNKSWVLSVVFTSVPLALFTLLIGLELAVSLIQGYVFTILTASYIKDATQLH